jgi:F0F1-type ATP synthase membrane subunit c/vacuolar-type H+-ATPase subunit K
MIGAGLLIFLAVIGVAIWFNINMMSAMNAISQQNRRMDGGLVWLNIIPIFNFVWPFIFNNALSTSFKSEFQEKNISKNVNLVSGIIYPIASILIVLFPYIVAGILYSSNDYYYYTPSYYSISGEVGVIYLCIIIVGLVMQIIFWTNVNELKRALVSNDLRTIYSNNPRQMSVPNNTPQNPTYQAPYVPNQPNMYEQAPVAPTFGNERNVDSNTEKSPNQSEVNSGTIKLKQKESAIDKIKKYHEMLEEGLISQEDFDKIKAELINLKD